jgi:hypothetical protein
MACCRLLELPRELRDEIYAYYLATDPDGDDAYVFNFESNKLRRADKQPIDLRLTYKCKTIAKEMLGMPLSLNTITFRTIYSDELRALAGRFDFAVDEQECTVATMFNRAAPK